MALSAASDSVSHEKGGERLRAVAAAKLAGLAIACGAPSLFWMLAAHVTALSFGYVLSPAVLAATGLAIALFLFSVCAPMFLARRAPAH